MSDAKQGFETIDSMMRNLASDYVRLDTTYGRGWRRCIYEIQRDRMERAALMSGAMPGEFSIGSEMRCTDYLWEMVPRLC